MIKALRVLEQYVNREKYSSYEIPAQVRARMKQPKKLTISEWSGKYRRVTEIDAVPGRWRNDLVPHTVKIMDTIGQAHVREVWICAVERAAKTQIMINTCLWTIDRAAQSGNIFWLMPTELDARGAMKNRIIPAITACHRTSRHLSRYADDTTSSGVHFKNGLKLRPAWSNSPGSMASYFGRLNIADEIDKFPERTSEGTDPITLFKKRSRDDSKNSKYVFASTPAGRYIYQGTMECEQVHSYRCKCPDCHTLIDMDIDHLIIPDGITYDDVSKYDITYACNHCGSVWDESKRELAYMAGDFVAIKGADIVEPSTVGFHFPALPCPKVSMQEIAAAYLKSKTGDYVAQCAWSNGYLAIDAIHETQSAVTAETVLKFKTDLPRNAVPNSTARLFLTIDTQQNHFYYQLWAVGYKPSCQLHMVRHGQLHHFEEIEGLIKQDWQDSSGKKYKISGGVIDSGGTKRAGADHSRTVEVYHWCSKNKIIAPLKGTHGRSGDILSYKPVTTFPGTNRAIPGGLTRVNVRVSIFKDMLERTLALQPDDVAAIQFHSGIDDVFANHFTSEYKDDKGNWIHDRNRGRNDYADCAVYALAYREMIQLTINNAPEDKKPQEPEKKKEKPKTKPRPQTPKWHQNRS